MEEEIKILEKIIPSTKENLNKEQENLEETNRTNQRQINDFRQIKQSLDSELTVLLTNCTQDNSLEENTKIYKTKILNLYFDAKKNINQKDKEKKEKDKEKQKSEKEMLLLQKEGLLIALRFNLKTKKIDLMQIDQEKNENIENKFISDADIYLQNFEAIEYRKILEKKLKKF
ncbi:hypothetical protein LFWB_1190 [Candidatus Phytoplasma luffae]|uniref:Uncharacterized protein n=1 Tax=Loofah witches'-broom phytoplasma TaxID=35773 RepID=A0A975IM32_LOWBP|nr:hypothetical protein [Candidatus Phytoplasma luffae]QTX02689.1 hypothetical protein LFWB_1190 [Candidatus Phytoplasma luffae]